MHEVQFVASLKQVSHISEQLVHTLNAFLYYPLAHKCGDKSAIVEKYKLG